MNEVTVGNNSTLFRWLRVSVVTEYEHALHHVMKGFGSTSSPGGKELTWVMNNMASCFVFLEGNQGSSGKHENIPVLVTHFASAQPR